jgi:hypothetical protein
MPDLERHAVMDWVTVCEPAIAYGCAAPIRAVEDEDDIHVALMALGDALDRHAASGAGLLVCLRVGETGRDMQAVLTQLGPARLLRLLHWLSSNGEPDRAEVLRTLLGDTYGSAAVLRATLQTLHRQALLARIFDEPRLRALLAACMAAREELSA